MANQRRLFQIAEKIRNGIAWQLQRVADPRFDLVTITSVVISPDMRQAKIYWMVSGGTERRLEVEEAFKGANGLFRKGMAKDLGVRFVPELKFFYDNTMDTHQEVDELFRRIAHSSSK